MTSNLVCSFVSGMPSGRTNNFPRKCAWPKSRDRTIFGIRSNISPKLLELETSNLVGGFVLGMPSTNNFPESGRGLGHVTTTIFGSTVGYPSDSLASFAILVSCKVSVHGPLRLSVASIDHRCFHSCYASVVQSDQLPLQTRERKKYAQIA